MNIEKTVYTALEKIIGISESDFADYKDTDLIESGILDSMSIVSLLNEISRLTGKKIPVTKLKAADFASIDVFMKAIGALI